MLFLNSMFDIDTYQHLMFYSHSDSGWNVDYDFDLDSDLHLDLDSELDFSFSLISNFYSNVGVDSGFDLFGFKY